MSVAATRHYRFESYRLDVQTRELRQGDGPALPLTTKAFDTLCYLIEHRQRVVGKDELLAAVWPGRVVEENNLNQAIAALRRALGTSAGEHRYVVTVPGRGYRFVADVREIPAAAPEPLPEPAEPLRSGAKPTVDRRPALAIMAGARRNALALGLMALAGLLAALAWHYSPSGGVASRPMPAASPAPVARTTLAVLPFRSLSSGPRDQLLELGLAETLITRLGRSSALSVRSLGSSERASLAQDDALAAGRHLGAAYVIDGTTQRLGEQVRINARLLAVASGATVWADTFDARIDRVFTLQDQISAAVTSALSLAPLETAGRGASACDGGDPEAYRALLAAQYQQHRRSPDTLAAFQRAIALDPTCARAYAGLTITYLFMAHNDGDPGDVFPLARAAAAQALRLDPDSAEAHMAQGRQQQLHAWAWDDAEASQRRAIEINPSLAEAHFALAHLLVSTGRFDEGLAAARQARELDPLSPLINALEAGFLTAARRPAEARVAVQRALGLQPDFWVALLVRGGMALDRGDPAAAIADLRRASETSGRASQVLAMLAVAHMAAGERAPAQALLRELEARDAAGYVAATSLAAVRNALGDTEGAIGLLERAHRERDIRLAFLEIDARWNNLRAHPRFLALARRMDLETGRAYGRY